jgi:hypothetical protein
VAHRDHDRSNGAGDRQLHVREGPAALGPGRSKLPARYDAELGEHFAQMPFNRSGTDEQLRASVSRGHRQDVSGRTYRASWQLAA